MATTQQPHAAAPDELIRVAGTLADRPGLEHRTGYVRFALEAGILGC